MTDNVIMVILGFIGALLVAIKPILDLNTNITELKVSIDQFRDSVNKLDSRITEHGKEIDKIKETVVDHEARIKTRKIGGVKNESDHRRKHYSAKFSADSAL